MTDFSSLGKTMFGNVMLKDWRGILGPASTEKEKVRNGSFTAQRQCHGAARRDERGGLQCTNQQRPRDHQLYLQSVYLLQFLSARLVSIATAERLDNQFHECTRLNGIKWGESEHQHTGTKK